MFFHNGRMAHFYCFDSLVEWLSVDVYERLMFVFGGARQVKCSRKFVL